MAKENIQSSAEAEFYIGWMPAAPNIITKHIRKVLLLLFIIVIILAGIFALQQKKFSTASFEFGQLTEIRGIYQQQPVPSIKVITQQDIFGNTSYITIPLVGYGKFGAEGTITALEKEKHTPFNNKEVSFKGTLLYSDGKTLLQIDKNDNPLTSISTLTSPHAKNDIRDLGNLQLQGEILDPKCYFGVMKPGHGKPHRDCAIRCIAGGMDPVFYTLNKNGEANYYLILGANGEKINGTLKDYIGEPVTLNTKAVQYDDWIVLYIDNKKPIKRITGLSWMKDDEIACGK